MADLPVDDRGIAIEKCINEWQGHLKKAGMENIEGVLLGVIYRSEPIKPDAPPFTMEMECAGRECWLVFLANGFVAEQIASKVAPQVGVNPNLEDEAFELMTDILKMRLIDVENQCLHGMGFHEYEHSL